MKLKQIITAAAIGVSLVGLGFWLGGAYAATAEPGSSADPLVSRSYVDQALAGVATKGYVDSAVALLNDKSYVDQAVAKLADKSYVDSRTLFAVVNVPQGSMLGGDAGTEIVLRAGRGTIMDSRMGGVLDATAGLDLRKGTPVSPQHLLVIPVSDGRGVIATADSIFIVKGTYTVKPAGQ